VTPVYWSDRSGSYEPEREELTENSQSANRFFNASPPANITTSPSYRGRQGSSVNSSAQKTLQQLTDLVAFIENLPVE
jgi:hypothetical protein